MCKWTILSLAIAITLLTLVPACSPAPSGCESCDDAIACTVDSCDEASGACRHTPENAQCNAPEVCDGRLGCVVPSTSCQSDKDCDNANPCTSDTCDLTLGSCVHGILVGLSCDDGDPCTEADTCAVSGGCQGNAMICEDGDPCTADRCDPTTLGCVSTPASGATCDDLDACTTGDLCQADGTCLGGTAVDCDDSNPCTADSCDASSGCAHQPAMGGACDDGDPCTNATTCQSDGSCGGGTGVSCDDGDPCTADSCDAAGTCAHTPAAGASCDDGDACTTGTLCQADGSCAGGGALDCDRGNPCELATCDPTASCTYQSQTGLPCSDGDACTTGDTCDASAACVGALTSCDDNNPCTDDSCDPTSGGCSFVPNISNTCSDGDLCTTGDACDASGACAGTAVSCDDNNLCTADSCNGADGSCVFTDTGICSPVGWCRLQFPLDLTDLQGTSTTFYGRVFVSGVTDPSDAVDAGPALRAEFGYGPDGSDPSTTPGSWTWTPATGNPGWSAAAASEPGNDEYQATLNLPSAAASPYDFAFRFSNDYGTTWLSCDRATGTVGEDGSENGYQVINAGQLVTTP